MAQIVWTDHVFDTEDEAWRYVTEHYTVEKNSVMRKAKREGKKVSVGVRKRGKANSGSGIRYVIVIVVG